LTAIARGGLELSAPGLWSDGGKVVAQRGPMIGVGNFENDTGQLVQTEARD
jgi:hypothetical protein